MRTELVNTKKLQVEGYKVAFNDANWVISEIPLVKKFDSGSFLGVVLNAQCRDHKVELGVEVRVSIVYIVAICHLIRCAQTRLSILMHALCRVDWVCKHGHDGVVITI